MVRPAAGMERIDHRIGFSLQENKPTNQPFVFTGALRNGKQRAKFPLFGAIYGLGVTYYLTCRPIISRRQAVPTNRLQSCLAGGSLAPQGAVTEQMVTILNESSASLPLTTTPSPSARSCFGEPVASRSFCGRSLEKASRVPARSACYSPSTWPGSRPAI